MKTKQLILLAAVLSLLGLALIALGTGDRPSAEFTVSKGGGTVRTRTRGVSTMASASRHPEARPHHSLQGTEVTACCAHDGPPLVGNPLNTVRMADSLEPGELRDRLLQQAIRAWAFQAPEQARRWVEEHLNTAERDLLLLATEEEQNRLDSIDPSEKKIVDQLDEAVRRSASDDSYLGRVENLTERWAGENMGAARNWVMSQPESENRDALVHRIALAQAGSDPAEAARWVAENISSESRQAEAAVSVVHRWALQDAAAATAWVKEFPDGLLKLRVQRELEGIAAYRANENAPSPTR